jgi:hypothetical protein
MIRRLKPPQEALSIYGGIITRDNQQFIIFDERNDDSLGKPRCTVTIINVDAVFTASLRSAIVVIYHIIHYIHIILISASAKPRQYYDNPNVLQTEVTSHEIPAVVTTTPPLVVL